MKQFISHFRAHAFNRRILLLSNDTPHLNIVIRVSIADQRAGSAATSSCYHLRLLVRVEEGR